MPVGRPRDDGSDMLDTIKTVTGYDPTACAQTWLLDLTQQASPTPAACP